MATRLYPNHKTPELLERLAGVPQGTYERLAAVDDKYCAQVTGDGGQRAHYLEVSLDSNLSALETLRTSGWGKLTPTALAVIQEIGTKHEYGKTTDPILVRRVLVAQNVDLRGVSVDEIKGVCWS